MVEYRPECGIWCKEYNNHLRLKRQRLMKLFLWIQCEVADNHVVFFGGCRNGLLWVEVNGVDSDWDQ